VNGRLVLQCTPSHRGPQAMRADGKADRYSHTSWQKKKRRRTPHMELDSGSICHFQIPLWRLKQCV